jgi:GNAT superfamily N-acetyltransferase
MIRPHPDSPKPIAQGDAVCRRCHEAGVIEQALREDYYDVPIRYFPGPFLRRAVRELLAPSPDVYFVTAELQGQYAGFVFGHTLGQNVWRRFARANWARHPLSIVWLLVRLRLLMPFRQRLARRRRTTGAAGRAGPANHGLTFPKLNHPFRWSAERPDIGHIDMVFVRDKFRGLRLASQLIGYTTTEMARQGVTLVEAHVDADNSASRRAFLKAGWEVFQTAGGDYYLRFSLRGPAHGHETGLT